MNNQTKMIIITSNEDLIQQFYSNKSSNTRIIELDEKNSTNFISKDNNNLIDLNFLAQLSELNSNNDQMYKRVLDSPQDNRSKIAKTSKKSIDLLCTICKDHAIGFNYDVLTCASCKAFFRRNAQYQPEKLRCLIGENNCSVNHEIIRKCQRCRLSKCLSMGMRKDFILSEEEKQKRRQRIEENRRLSNKYQSSIEKPVNDYISQSIDEIDRLLMDTENSNPVLHNINNNEMILYEGLSIEDWSDIENIRSNYSSIFENENEKFRYFDISDRTSALVSWSQFASERAIKLINFFQQIDEFENLNNNDKFILIKFNLLSLFLIQKCIDYNPLTGRFINKNNEDLFKRRQFFRLCYGTSGIGEDYMNFIRSLSIFTEQDSTLIKLLIIILLFSKGLSMSENESILNNILAVHQAQSYYIKLTWNYLIYKYGLNKTIKLFIQLMTQIQTIQSFTKHFRDFFRTQNQSLDILEQLAPIMQAVLNIQ